GPVDVGFADERLAERCVAQHLQLAAIDRGTQLLPRRRLVERCARLEAEQYSPAPGRGLRPEVGAGVVLLVGEADDGGAEPRALVGLRQAEADRSTALATDLAHQGHL